MPKWTARTARAGAAPGGICSRTSYGRAAIASVAMMHFIAFFDVLLAFFRMSTGLSTFGFEAVTETGRASRARMLARSAVMWGPVVVPSAILASFALAEGRWVSFNAAATLGAVSLAGAAVFAGSALANPARGLHDRIAGVWVSRR